MQSKVSLCTKIKWFRINISSDMRASLLIDARRKLLYFLRYYSKAYTYTIDCTLKTIQLFNRRALDLQSETSFDTNFLESCTSPSWISTWKSWPPTRAIRKSFAIIASVGRVSCAREFGDTDLRIATVALCTVGRERRLYRTDIGLDMESCNGV